MKAEVITHWFVEDTPERGRSNECGLFSDYHGYLEGADTTGQPAENLSPDPPQSDHEARALEAIYRAYRDVCKTARTLKMPTVIDVAWDADHRSSNRRSPGGFHPL